MWGSLKRSGIAGKDMHFFNFIRYSQIAFQNDSINKQPTRNKSFQIFGSQLDVKSYVIIVSICIALISMRFSVSP